MLDRSLKKHLFVSFDRSVYGRNEKFIVLVSGYFAWLLCQRHQEVNVNPSTEHTAYWTRALLIVKLLLALSQQLHVEAILIENVGL